MAQQQQLNQWQLESDGAQAYERYLVPAIFREGARQIVELANITPGEHIIDVGCGTGIVARTASDRTGPGGSVTGVDLNPGMLEVARVASTGVTPEIEWKEGAAESLPIARSSADAVLSQQGFQFFSDRNVALQEMRRVLKPGGRAVVAVLRSVDYNTNYGAVVEVFSRHGGEELGKMMQSPFPDFSIEDLRSMFTGAGFDDVRITISLISARFPSVPEFLQHELSSSPLSGIVAEMSDETRAAIATDLSRSLGGYLDDAGVLHPLQTWLIHAR